MRPPTTICPRCKVREKVTTQGYCRECAREVSRETRLRRLGITKPICPICGSSDIKKGHHYCRKCAELEPEERLELLQQIRRKSAWEGLQKDAQEIDFLRLRAEKAILAPSPKPVPISLSDFIGRDNEPSIFQHL